MQEHIEPEIELTAKEADAIMNLVKVARDKIESNPSQAILAMLGIALIADTETVSDMITAVSNDEKISAETLTKLSLSVSDTLVQVAIMKAKSNGQ